MVRLVLEEALVQNCATRRRPPAAADLHQRVEPPLRLFVVTILPVPSTTYRLVYD